ncbi:MAG: alpha-amylase family glycosyl hydrolase, partial [Bacteroidota bacterium]
MSAVFACLMLFCIPLAHAQVTCDPVFPTVEDNVTIYYDATQGNAALVGVAPVYAHMGVITNLSTGPSDWKHVTTTWGTADAVGAMQADGTNKWKKTINIKTFFNIQANETVLKLSFVFRNTAGSIVGRAADGSDIFYDVYPVGGPLQTIILNPTSQSFLSSVGAQIPVKAAASKSGTLQLLDNGSQVSTATGLNLQTTINASAGFHKVQFIANAGAEKDTASFVYVVPNNTALQNPPAGTQLGINYVDNQTVRLELYAPKKQVVYAIGDFSGWQPDPGYQMKLSLDSTTWWIELNNLPAGQPVRFQYLVNGILRIADPLSTLVLSAGDDPYIPPFTYPNLPAYPVGKTSGAVSVLQTAQTPFNWTATSYQRPKKADLVVYELLMRDFIARHDFNTLTDTLDYLERLGVTAIELMPINEFDGNISWGYNPGFHKALDKYYGTAEALKTLVDACHARGMAVILDVVFNQASGSSPLAQLYWDAANNRPAADNPWLNPIAKHDYNVFNDFNHESIPTKNYVKNCLQYWLTEFKVDGFRFDLSKGFTQKNTLGNVSAWGAYDASRIAIWKDYANYIWSVDPQTYIILEHFADNTEEKELAEYGMMLWGNMNGAYKDVGLGGGSAINTSLNNISYKYRNWAVPHLVGYMESHDEERIMVECKNNGAVSGSYNIKSTQTALQRIELLNNLLYTVPGPKMLWEFGELGYDFSINLCENGTISGNCRTNPKPIRWDYNSDPARRRLYGRLAGLLRLRKNYDLFETTDFQINLGSGRLRSVRLNSPTLNAVAAGNIGVIPETGNFTFPHTGTWYDYYTGTALDVTNTTTNLTLNQGEYRLWLDQNIPFPSDIIFLQNEEVSALVQDVSVYPNPTSGVLCSLDFAVIDNSRIQIAVTDMTGKQITQVQTEMLAPGDYHYEFNTTTWNAGVYFITLRDASGARLTRKLV